MEFTVFIDKEKILQALNNILSNAFKFTEKGGEVSIQLYATGSDTGKLQIERADHTETGYAVIEISDSGIGIKASFEKKPEIKFESTAHLIQKVLTTPISSKRRSGYGLCQVNDIIKELEGSIYIRTDNASLMSIYRKKNSKPYMFIKNGLTHFNGTQFSISLVMKR